MPSKPPAPPLRGWGRTFFNLGRRKVNRYDLYELAVQAPAMEAAFIRAVHADSPRVLGEDFCGPASVSRAWCATDPDALAVAADKSFEPLEHARVCIDRHDLESPEPIADRVTLLEQDVLSVKKKADAVAALNFAVCELHRRSWLMTYLRAVIYRLRPGGIFMADLYAGSDAYRPGISEKTIPTPEGPLRYQWEQRDADPFTGMVTNAMHFILPGRFSEESRTVRDAFVYRWRLWSVAELREAMREAGFISTEVYTSYGDAIDSDGRLYVRPAATDTRPLDPDDLDDNFVAYVVGRVNAGR